MVCNDRDFAEFAVFWKNIPVFSSDLSAILRGERFLEFAQDGGREVFLLSRVHF